MYSDVTSFCVGPQISIQEGIRQMEKNKEGLLLVVDEEKYLLGTVTDGDIRRAILQNISLDASIGELLRRKEGTKYARPLTARVGKDRNFYLQLLKKHELSHLPLLDSHQKLVGLATVEEFATEPLSGLQAVVMAGGKGVRLHPLTEDLPKPMLPVGQKPLLEIIVSQLRSVGIRRVNVTTHHKPEKIEEYFGNGNDFGINLDYVSEEKPLGTAGSLRLMVRPSETVLVMNGDILTQIDFKAMLQFHREHEADLTVAVRRYDFGVPYGVIECEGSFVKTLREKPVFNFLVNAGIYLLEPNTYSYIPEGEYCDMTDLIETLIAKKRQVISFPVHEEWLDIGNHTEYQLAQQESHKYQTKAK